MEPKLITLPPVVVELKIEGRPEVVKSNVHEELMVGEQDINTHIDECSSRFVYWAVIDAEVKREYQCKDLDNKTWLAKQKKEAMGSLKTGEKLGSETAKEDAVILAHLEEYMKLNKELIECEYRKNVVASIVTAWKMKADLLVSLATNYRQEMQSGISLKKWNAQFKPLINSQDLVAK